MVAAKMEESETRGETRGEIRGETRGEAKAFIESKTSVR